MYDTILIPTDGSDHSVRAAEHGAFLARAFDAEVHLINVFDVQGAAGVFDAGGVDSEFVDRLKAESERTVDELEAVVSDAARLQTATVRGEPSETILEYAAEHDVDMIAMGTHGRTGVNRYIAGSVAERVIRLADVPVLTARANARSEIDGDYGDVLVPTDGSEAAAVAIEHGVAIAAAVDARVHAVTAVDVGELGTGPDYPQGSELREYLADRGAEATEAIATRAEEAGLTAVTDVREGPPAKTLLAYADEHDVDLIVMGTHGRTGLNRYLLGSTTERVIRHSDAPVLAVNAREIDREQ
jgi:nucleotide-binding universal stress UspA family protein